MHETAIDLEIFSLALPLTIGVVQLLKEAGLPGRWAGLAALATGLLAGLGCALAGVGEVAITTESIRLAILTGAIAGLSAAGVWSGAKALYDPPANG
jgi:hypothetical protein